jgi:rhodanese-related sulfurtransferase
LLQLELEVLDVREPDLFQASGAAAAVLVPAEQSRARTGPGGAFPRTTPGSPLPVTTTGAPVSQQHRRVPQ